MKVEIDKGLDSGC